MLREDPRQSVRLKDYRAPDYLIDRVALDFDIHPGRSRVRARMAVRVNPEGDGPGSPLILDGEGLQLDAIAVDDRALAPDDYLLEEEGLRIPDVPERFTLEVHTTIRPEDNTELEGLYKAGNLYCTQCEAEGFRKITYYLDRPDVMAVYSVRICADKKTCPVLLSNGNLVEEGEEKDGRHWARWDDPHPKPSYLFALVAGDLAYIEDRHVTPSAREVTLRIYAEEENLQRCRFAMESLKNAMRWDEERFGLECDLDNYNVVATNDFNMGAMENKGLNIFNAQYVLADSETATDADFQHVEGVIGHEYFHNWTGNRVTCRDWFQLSLKEGLTVFRDQEFSSDMQSRAVKRIDDVRQLRATQFPEDAGPMVHPVRPESYIEVNNFYTATVYEKGAEVVRMYHTLLGEAGFRRGMDLYFARHDGQAVTCDDFRGAMADANDRDLSQFARWYSQAGTPVLRAAGRHDPKAATFTLSLHQQVPETPDQASHEPFHMPVAVGLLDERGEDLPLRLAGQDDAVAGTRVLELTETGQDFTFVNVPEAPVPSLLRGFSAPVQLRYDYSIEDLAFLMAHDSDAFNRWDAGQQFATRLLLDSVADIQAGREPSVADEFIEACRITLTDARADKALIAEALTLPDEGYLAEQVDVIDVDAIHQARRFLRRSLAHALKDDLLRVYDDNREAGRYRIAAGDIARRRLRNCALAYLMNLDDAEMATLCVRQFEEAGNMTDRLAALVQLVHNGAAQRDTALEQFYDRWQDDPLVLNKWFNIQASDPRPGAIERVRTLSRHPAFTLRNPNRVRALLGAFGVRNRVGFHAADGAGYEFMTEHILALDPVNPQVASRLAGLFNHWKRFDPARRDLQRGQLQRLAGQPGLSRNTYEIVSRALV